MEYEHTNAQADIRTIFRTVFELHYYNIVRSESDLGLKLNSSCTDVI